MTGTAPGAVADEGAPTAGADTPLVSYVNPFIGTQDEGNTYPGATVPFGMVQFSPDNGHNVGYDHGNDRIRGFSLVHLSGVGCGLGGHLPVLPTTGPVTSTNYAQYALGYSHDDEEASPGYYRVGLQAPTGTIDAELTATTRTAVQRYTFPPTTQANVLLNTGQALNQVTSSSVRIVDDRTVEATITARGFCQDTEPFTLHTRTEFDRPFAAHGTWTGFAVSAGSQEASGSGNLGAYLTFDTTGGDLDVEAVTALSYVDADGAAANLAAEGGTFDEVRDAATATWEERLGTVQVADGALDDLRTFYSSLYRSFLAPNTGSDVDGRYRGWDQEVHTAGDFTYYQNFSLWDTYRTQQQLLALLAPQESRDQARSLVLQTQQGGWLPRWGYGTVETNIMTGDPGTPFLVSAYHQGLLEGFEEEAYAVLRENADEVPPADSPFHGRAANPEYVEHGFVPHDPGRAKKRGDFDPHHGGSATLEYALADAMLATMAADLGHVDDAERYAARGQNYRSVIDPRTGWVRARGTDGLFLGDPNPARSTGFHEGSAVQYQWLVPQDVDGLVEVLGGVDETVDRLDAFFAYDELLLDPEGTAREVWVSGAYDYYDQDTYNPNNEPNLHAPYVYLWTGQPWKTTDVVRAALTLFTDGPDGVTGNDDLGTMSAWHVLSALGIYPAVPGTDTWALTTPLFEDVTLTLDDTFHPTDALRILAPGVSDDARYTASVTLGGQAVARGYVTGPELVAGGELAFEVATVPGAWATGPGAAPAPVAPTDVVPGRLFAGLAPAVPVVAPGEDVEVTASVVAQGAGDVAGTVEIAGAGPVGVDAPPVEWSTTSGGLPATVEVPVTLSAAPDAAPGTYRVQVTVRTTDGREVVREVPVVVPQDSWLAEHLDNVGIGDEGEANADFDGLGYYLLRDRLAAAGVVQGAELTVPGTDLTYVLHPADAGAPDNVLARGQQIAVPAELAGTTRLALVGSSGNGHQSGNLVLTYTDGTSSTHPVTLGDWCTGSPTAGNVRVVQTGERGDGTGTQNVGCGLFATAPIDLDDGKELASVTLPQAPNMHVFAIATDAGGAVEPGLGVEATVETRCVAGRVTLAVRAVNGGDEVLDVTLATPFGSRTVTGVAPGAVAYQSFATRSPDVVATTVSVTVRPSDPADERVETSTEEVEGRTCG